jgi:hypothetical protein
MTPKEKARELVDKYYHLFSVELENTIADYEAKECALIAVDEVLENVNYFFNELEKDGLPNKFDDEIEYWNQIKQEIIKL